MVIRKDVLNSLPRWFFLVGMVLLGTLLAGMSAKAHADTAPELFDNLQKRLIADGFDSARIQAIFASPSVSFEKKGVSAYFMHNEAKLNYKQFTYTQSIASAKAYMQTHQQALEAAQKKYGVDKEVITAIILVETKLGSYTGNKSVINTLATLSALTEAAPRQIIWDSLPDNDLRISPQEFEKKADQKASWAYRELKAFLIYTENQGIDPTTIKGSYAGALGISQFMPTNVIAYAKDGNDDGRIDLFDHADAISSIAAYLKHYGWVPGISREKALKVVYHYNHSKYYTNTILDVADQLKG